MVATFDPFGAALMINRSNCIYLSSFCVFDLDILSIIGLSLLDTVSINLAQ